MRKSILIIAILLGSISLIAQGEISFGLSTKYQKKAPTEEWSGWKEPTGPILIYMDLGFGFLAIDNGYNDKFILDLKTTSQEEDSPSKRVFSVKAIDNTGKACTLAFTYFSTGDFALTVLYNDIHYSYWCDEEHGAQGYPYKFFDSKPPEPTESPRIKSPSTYI